jgi:hypothetical protein
MRPMFLAEIERSDTARAYRRLIGKLRDSGKPDGERTLMKPSITTRGLVALLALVLSTACGPKEATNRGPKLAVPIAGVWATPLVMENIYYVITHDPDASEGKLVVEAKGKTLHEYKFTVSAPNEIQIAGATEGPHVFTGAYVDMKVFAGVFQLNKPPKTLRMEPDNTVKAPGAEGGRNLRVTGLFRHENDKDLKDRYALLERMSETSRTLLPFEDVKAGLRLRFDNVLGSVSPDMDPSKTTFKTLVHPSGQVNHLKINGRVVELIDPHLKDGMLRTRDFGDFELLSAGTRPGQTVFFVTRSQIHRIARWLGTNE